MARCKINRYHLAKALHRCLIVRLISSSGFLPGQTAAIGGARCELRAVTHMPAGLRNAAWRNIHGTDAQTHLLPSQVDCNTGPTTLCRLQRFPVFSLSLGFSLSTVVIAQRSAAVFGSSLSSSILTELRGKARELGSAGDVHGPSSCFFLSPPMHADSTEGWSPDTGLNLRCRAGES